jgi:hypothetical protein
LCIDPQLQANKFIRNQEKHNKLQCVKLTQDDFARKVENAVKFG